jgi:iron complex transport system permease protein
MTKENKQSNQLLESYRNYLKSKYLYLIVCFILLIILLVTGIGIGPTSIGWSDILSTLNGENSGSSQHVILHLRMPRLVAAMLSGAALAVSGVVMQSVLRNPLGSPFTLGISNAAAFGAAFAYIFLTDSTIIHQLSSFIPIIKPLLVTISAFVWAMIACFFILLVARMRGTTPENMILTGIIASTLFTALTSVLQYLADDIKLASIVFWTFGDLSKGGWNELTVQFLILVPIVFYFIRKRMSFNALDSGDDVAYSLGVQVSSFRLRSMVLASLMTACIVSFYGIIAFVGLVIPHIVRRLIGGDERFLLPASALTGAIFLMLCDIVARTVLSPIVIPVGILTSLIGAPLFIFLLIKGKRYQA